MANINVVNADDETETSTNPDRFADIRTGNPDRVDNSGPEADAKLEDNGEPSNDSAPAADEPAPVASSNDNDAEQSKPAEEETPTTTPDPETSIEPTKPEPAVDAAAGAATAHKVTSGTGKKDKHLGRLLFEIVLLIAIAGLAFWGYGLMQDNDKLTQENKTLAAENSKLNSNPAIIAQKEADTVLVAVGKLVKLPTDETPTVASVTDVNAAKKQSAFFVNAQNGDKVLFYVKTGQAILYRPSTNTIIAQGPLTLNNTSTSTKRP